MALMSACMSSQSGVQATVWNSLVSSSNSFRHPCTAVGRSFMNMINKTGPSTLPYGTLLVTSIGADETPFTVTHCCLPVKNDLIRDRTLPPMQ